MLDRAQGRDAPAGLAWGMRPSVPHPSHANAEACVPEPWWLGAHTGAAWGLSQLQADEARARWGPNSFEPQAKRSLALQFLARLRNPLVLVLLAASTISAATGDIANAGIIVLMVLLSVTLDFVQEHRASNAAEKLRASVALRARVLRDGATREIPVTEVMPGDLMLLSAGDRVPADGLVLEARDFFVNQSLLTGESYPVEKRPDAPSGDAPELQDALHAVFMGSTVISGSARVGVMAIGPRTALGEVASSIQVEPPPTAFEIGMHRFGLMIMRLTLLLVLFVLLVNVVLHRPLLDSFLFAVALAVGLTPELLPMVVSVTLSRGAMRLAGRRVIVKRLASIQNLGAMDVLCTDKTGTLTEARISLACCADADGRDSARVLMLAHLNSTFESGLKSPLDEALLAHPMDTAAWKKIDEVPFDFERRRVSVLLDRGDARWLVVKGAPDDVLALCNRFERDEGRSPAPLDADALVQLRERCHALERQGLRVLGVAWRDVPADHPHADVRDESALVFAGFAAFIDPPKAGAGEAMAALARSGVHVKIVSGDSELVTQHLCTLLRIPVAGVLTGQEISAMDDIALRARVGRTTLFCRVNPAQKNRIILALRTRGHVVGYLGDGINDAPALRSADVGLTVDSAVDVAREVADIVMLDHDLGVLHEGVLEGRRTFGNVMKYIMMGTSSNFGNMLHGGRLAAAALPADAAGADPAQQRALRPVAGGHPARPRGCRRPAPAPHARHEVHPALHVAVRRDQLGLRRTDLLAADPGTARRCPAVSHRLVRRVARHPGAGDLRDPHPRPALGQPPRRGALRGIAPRRGRRAAAAFFAAGQVLPFRAAARDLLRLAGRHAGGLPGAGGDGQAILLRPPGGRRAFAGAPAGAAPPGPGLTRPDAAPLRPLQCPLI